MPNAAKTYHPPGWRPAEDRRPSASKRGYDRQWQQLAKRVLARDPWCVLCLERGVRRPSTVADYIRPFRGLDDPLRLDPKNTQGLCNSCNVAKGYRQRGYRGAKISVNPKCQKPHGSESRKIANLKRTPEGRPR